MRKLFGILALAAAFVPVSRALWAGASEIDDDLTASRRLFPSIGPGLRAVRHAANGNYYVLVSSSGVTVFDDKGKQLSVIGAPPPVTANKAGRSGIPSFGQDCDVDSQGNVYVADRGYNLVTEFAPDGKQLHAFPVDALLSLAVLPEGEVAVTALQSTHHVIVYGPDGKIVREFGDFESLSTRAEVDHSLNLGRVTSDPQGHIYYGFTYMPEPTVRKFDRFGNASQDFVFNGVDAYPEASATRKAIDRAETTSEAPTFRQILTAFGVDPVNGDVWMGMHNTLVHFDKDGIRRSEYQVWTPKGAPLDASVILVEEGRLLIGSDPLGVYEFHRPDRKR
jgi:DNA-binding beta-propeller fold protein YncE